MVSLGRLIGVVTKSPALRSAGPRGKAGAVLPSCASRAPVAEDTTAFRTAGDIAAKAEESERGLSQRKE
jgi:hypothetical protein